MRTTKQQDGHEATIPNVGSPSTRRTSRRSLIGGQFPYELAALGVLITTVLVCLTQTIGGPVAGARPRSDRRNGGGPIFELSLSPDGTRFVTCGPADWASIRDVSDGREVDRLQHRSRIMSVAWSPTDDRIVTGHIDGLVVLWSLSRGRFEVLAEFTDDGGPASPTNGSLITTCAFAPDGESLATGSQRGGMTLWDVKTGRAVALWREFDDAITIAAFSPDGRTLVCGSNDGVLGIFDIASRSKLHVVQAHDRGISDLDFAPDGSRMLTAAIDGTARLWSTDGWRAAADFEGRETPLLSACFSRDAETAYFGDLAGKLHIWCPSDGSRRVERPHRFAIRSLQRSPRDGGLVSAGYDGEVVVRPTGTKKIERRL